MKLSEIILVIIAILMVIVVAELGTIITSSKADANPVVVSNRELSASNNKLETIMTGVGEDLEIVVNKFCGGHKKK